MTNMKAELASTEAFAGVATRSGDVSHDERPTQPPALKTREESGTRHLPLPVNHPTPSQEPLKDQFLT